MSIYGAMFSGVSGLAAQSQALGMISDNIANVNTVGYKGTHVRFSTLVTTRGSETTYSPGGVRSTPHLAVDKQGLLQSSESESDLALKGSGFLITNEAVAAGAGNDYLYTRAGSFTTDKNGDLVNTAGLYLQGWKTNLNGVPLATNTSVLTQLETLNVRGLNGTAIPTSKVSVSANLPATATAGAVHTITSQIFDSLGVAHNLPMTFTKTATANTWTVTAGNPTLSSNGATVTGATAYGPGTLVFNGNGTLASLSTASVAITGWTTDSSNSTITLDVGTVGTATGVSQFSDTFTVNSIKQDGQRFGFFSGIAFDEDGIVTAQYDNGVTQKIYKLPVATFPNPNDLTARSGNAYAESDGSGAIVIQSAGTGATGNIAPSSLEASTVDLATEFTNMITTQRAYAASARIITTANEMLEELTRLVR